MKDSWICRDYYPGDESQILTLYKEVNNEEMTLAYWTWKFAKNPSGKAVMKLMFDNNKLIGLYAVIPMNLQVQKKLVKSALSVNTMTHPDYERQGIFTRLAEEVYEKCQREDFKFVYGFQQHAGKTVDGAYHFAGPAYRQRRDNVIGSVKQGVTVYKQQQRFFHPLIIADICVLVGISFMPVSLYFL